MASAELLKMTHSVDGKVMGVDGRVEGIEGKEQYVRGDVQDVSSEVQNVDRRVRGVSDKSEVDRSSSLYLLLLFLSTHNSSQETSSAIMFYGGFRPQIHPPIINLHAKLITTGQINGFLKEVYIITGNPLAPSYGYMESVRYSRPSSSVNIGENLLYYRT